MAKFYLKDGARIPYTRTEQRRATMAMLGLDADDASDRKAYKSIYDDVSRRVTQYNVLQALSDDSKLKAADVLFDVAVQRLREGITSPPTSKNIKAEVLNSPAAYSPSIENLYNLKLTSNTARYRQQIKNRPEKFIEIQIEKDIYVFSRFLNTTIDQAKSKFYDWLNEPVTVYYDISTGERVDEETATDLEGYLNLNDYDMDTLPRRDIIKDIKEVRDYLADLAAQRHSKYRRVYTDRNNNVYH